MYAVCPVLIMIMMIIWDVDHLLGSSVYAVCPVLIMIMMIILQLQLQKRRVVNVGKHLTWHVDDLMTYYKVL